MTHKEIDEYLISSTKANVSFDVVRGVVGNKFIVYYLSSLVDIKLVQLIYQLMENNQNNIYFGNIQQTNDINEILVSIFSGLLFVLPIDENSEYYLVETREYPTRGIGEPETEQTIRGSKDGFTESVITNVGLIRRRIRSKNLVFEKYQIGISSKSDVILTYMDDRVDKKYLSSLKSKLKDSENAIDSLIMSDRALEELLFHQKHNIYPLVKYSERPDIASIQILKGRIAIICDNSSSILISPTNIFEHIRHIEEYRQNPFIGSFLRCVRLLAIFFSMFLVPLWLCVIKEPHDDSIFLIPENISFLTIFLQVIVVEIMIEILRIATIHTPSKLSSTMGLVAALILGQFAVEIGIFSKEILLYCSLSAIGGFATPSYELSLSNKIIKIIIILFVGIFGKIGFLISLFLVFLYLVRIKIGGYPYLYPFVPFELNEFAQIFFRFGKESKKRVR